MTRKATLTLLAGASAVIAVIGPATPARNSVAEIVVHEGGWMPIVQQDHWAIMTIIGEAANQPFEGQVAVGRVIRNRMARKYSSDGTVIGTVLRAKQFSMWDDRARLFAANTELDSETYKVAAAAWVDSGKIPVSANPAVLYHTTAVHPSWRDAATVKKIAQIGDHIFYADEGGGI